MHNNIMAAGSRDRPPMLATGRYAQWRSRFLRYIDTRPNGDALRKCILTAQEMAGSHRKLQQEKLAPSCKVLQETLQTYQQQPQNFLKHQKQNVETTLQDDKNNNQTGRVWNAESQNGLKNSRSHVSQGKECARCKQAEKGVQLQAEQSDWLADTDEEIDEQELEAHYSYMAKISKSIRNTCAVETGDSNVIPDSPDMCDNDIQDDQNDVECDNERAALANLKLDVDDNKKIQKQLKKANATLTQELTECKSILAETSRTLGESNSIRDNKDVNGKPSMIDPARLPNTANGCKPKPRNWQASMSSRVSNKDVHLGEHRKQKPFLKFNDLQCPTCKKCLYSANHDECVLEYLSRLNPRASAQNKDAKSHKTTKRYMPVEKSSASKKPERQIPTGHRFLNKKTTTVPEKTMNPRSCLRWKPTGRIFKTIGLRWVPTGKIFAFSTNKVDSEPPNGSKEDITNQCESEQALNVSAGTLLSAGTSFNGQKQQRIDLNADALYNEKQENLRVCSGLAPPRQMTSDHNSSELGIHDHSNELSRSKLVPKVVPPADKTATSRQELELLFHHHITMLSEISGNENKQAWEIVSTLSGDAKNDQFGQDTRSQGPLWQAVRMSTASWPETHRRIT
ncbi:hypothetical protein Tco_0786502 [Tanacetum coccineum]